MKTPESPPAEAARLQTLRALNILDTPQEERFDRLTRMAKRLFDVPIALVSLVDENRQWFKSCVGLPVSETPEIFHFAVMRFLAKVFLLFLMRRRMNAFTITLWSLMILIFVFMQVALYARLMARKWARYVLLMINRETLAYMI